MPKYSKILGKVVVISDIKKGLNIFAALPPPSPHILCLSLATCTGTVIVSCCCSVLIDQNYTSSQCSQDSGLLGIRIKGAASRNCFYQIGLAFCFGTLFNIVTVICPSVTRIIPMNNLEDKCDNCDQFLFVNFCSI